MHRRLAFVPVLVCVAALAGAAPAAAQEDPKALFEQAMQEMDRGEYEAACPKLETSYKASGQKAPLRQWAECEARRGDDVKAVGLYDQFLAVATQDEAIASAKQERATSMAKLAEITFGRGQDAPADTVLTIEGIGPITFGKPVLLQGGKSYELTVTSAGRATKTSKVWARGTREGFDVPWRTEVQRASTRPDEPRETSDGLWIGGWVVFSVGAGAVVGAAVTGGLYLDARSQALDSCADREARTGCTDVEAIDRKDTLLIPNGILWGVAIAGIGASIPMLVVGDERRKDNVRIEPGLGAMTVRVTF